jgi:hypothetical protein
MDIENMKFLFCEDAFRPNAVDEAYIVEYECAINNGFDVLLYNFEDKILRLKGINDKLETVIYRGWMINPIEYAKLYNELLVLNYELINNPVEYQNCHYLPDSLKFIENYTPKTIFEKYKNEESIKTLIDKSKNFDGKAVIVKDYVKSEKHYWNTACFVQNSNDIEKLSETIKNLMSLRGNYLNEGIVIREYIELNILTNHSKSGMPLSEEYRLFFYKNEILCILNYWEEVEYGNMDIDLKLFENIAKNIENNFFTMDIAKNRHGEYIIIELGDGQVSGLPENADKNVIYKKISEKQISA